MNLSMSALGSSTICTPRIMKRNPGTSHSSLLAVKERLETSVWELAIALNWPDTVRCKNCS